MRAGSTEVGIAKRGCLTCPLHARGPAAAIRLPPRAVHAPSRPARPGVMQLLASSLGVYPDLHGVQLMPSPIAPS